MSAAEPSSSAADGAEGPYFRGARAGLRQRPQQFSKAGVRADRVQIRVGADDTMRTPAIIAIGLYVRSVAGRDRRCSNPFPLFVRTLLGSGLCPRRTAPAAEERRPCSDVTYASAAVSLSARWHIAIVRMSA